MLATLHRYLTIALAVLAVAAVVAAMLFHNAAGRADLRAAAADARADELAGQVAALKQAAARTEAATEASDTARQAMDAAAADINDRLARLEGRIHDRAPVPAVCPDPDPDLMRELAEGSNRFRAAADRLRGLRNAEGAATE